VPDPTTWKGRLYGALQDVQSPGQFATSAVYGHSLSTKPLVTVTGAGPVSIPLSKKQGEALLAAGKRRVGVELMKSMLDHLPISYSLLQKGAFLGLR
jgi:hypothetical protein